MARGSGNRSGYGRAAAWLDRSLVRVRVRWRTTLRHSWRRTTAAGLISVQGAVAAAIAWWIAHSLLHHPRPFFAPIAAIIVLDVSEGRRLVKAVQLVLGVALGIAIGDALIYEIGTGAWQVGLVVFLATVLAVFLTGNDTVVAQAASSAVLIATLMPPRGGGIYVTRFVDALVGGAIALLVLTLLLPANPVATVSRRAGPAWQVLADGLRCTAQALTARDAGAADQALSNMEAGGTKLNAFRESLPEGTETANVAPIRRGARGALARYGDVAQYLERSLANAQVLARRSVTLIRDEEPVPEQLPRSIGLLAEATEEVHRALADPGSDHRVAELSLQAVGEAADAYGAGLGFSGSTVVAQIRAIATDLLGAAQLPHAKANEMIRKVGGNPAQQ
jgi:uncharacterized membrane protein YgaE (UPF0421/DUF939 family)